MRITLNNGVAGNDLEKLFTLCAGLRVKDIFIGVGNDLYEDGKNTISIFKLKNKVEEVRKGGLNISAAAFPGISSDVLLGGMSDKITDICENIKIIGDAGIKTVIIFPWLETSGEVKEDERRWNEFCRVYKNVIKSAEEKGVLVANHGHRTKKYFLTNGDSYKRLFKAIPSKSNGFVFCMGCIHFAGGDLTKTIEELSDKIYWVHVRDLKVKSDVDMEETHFGEGEVDIASAFKALKKINYKGNLSVEHIPAIMWDGNKDLLSQVQAIGYMKALL